LVLEKLKAQGPKPIFFWCGILRWKNLLRPLSSGGGNRVVLLPRTAPLTYKGDVCGDFAGKDHINVETYILLRDDEIGRGYFSNVLIDKAAMPVFKSI
jgi:hypothetical protein